MSFKENLNVLEKAKKSTKLFLFQSEKKLEKLIKILAKVLQLHLTKQKLLIAQDLW